MLIICDESQVGWGAGWREISAWPSLPPSLPLSHGCFVLKQNIINNSRLFLNLTLERVVHLRGTGSGGCSTGVGAAQPLLQSFGCCWQPKPHQPW